MDLSKHFGDVRIVGHGDRVYKDECVCSFDTPDSPYGLYICMKNFEAVGADFLDYHYARYNYSVYLHHKRLKFRVNRPESTEIKPKRLAIGVEGGFDPEAAKKEFRYEDTYSILVFPQRYSIPLPNLDLPDLILQSVSSIIASESTENIKDETNVWDGEKRNISKYADDLEQLPNAPKAPPSGWKCEKCDLKENLWLNLTDGSILCGRRFYDGTGGNNHAVDHYEECKYPLAVKLGTITPNSADVYSYPEEDMVVDPHLDRHLQHFGIDIQKMTKTEKSMLELEIDINEKLGEWHVIQEEGKNLEPVCGPGFTGLANMGNSCYMNSVLQVLFSVDEFQKRYSPPRDIFYNCDSISNFNHQMAKLAHGLMSGKYSIIEDNAREQKGINPKSFKHFVCGSDRNFSTKRQQDAHEFFLYLMDLVEKNHNRATGPDAGKCFEVVIEERIECSVSKKVRYTHRAETCLSLHIDLNLATNTEDVREYEAAKIIDPNCNIEVVRPNINMASLMDLFAKPETITDFYSTAILSRTTAQKTSRISKYPDVLVLQIKKFQCGDDWIPKKLDISIEAPDVLNLEGLEAKGIQAGEEKLSDSEDNSEASASSAQGTPQPDPEAVATLTSMGIDAAQAIEALKLCNNDTQRAIECIFDPDSFVPSLHDTPGSSSRTGDSFTPVPDERPKLYQLKAFISHMGTSTMCGHYVCHIRKGDRWYIYNDNKVARSQNPPKEFGYLYFYERIIS